MLAVDLCEDTGFLASATVHSLLSSARYRMAVSWCTFPAVFIVLCFGLSWPTATLYARVGYAVAAVGAKAVFGVMFWTTASASSLLEEVGKLQDRGLRCIYYTGSDG